MHRRHMLALAAATAAAPRAFAQDYVIKTPNGVDDGGGFVNVGGVDQWLRIRGDDRDNPVILYVHGGPGAGLSPAWNLFTRMGWERRFTMAYWDQQGAARTYVRNGRTIPAGLTIERIAEDGAEIAGVIARKTGKRKIILLGGSWGSHMAIRIAKRRPELFHAYVGTAQTVRTSDGEPLAYQRVLAKARALGNETAVKELEAAGPPPYPSIEQFIVQRKWANSFERPAPTPLGPPPGVTPEDVQDGRTAFIASDTYFRGADMQGPIKDIDVYAMGRDFRMPVFIFQGDDDFITPAALVEPWFNWIRAPKKELVLLEGGGHNIFLRTPRFLELMEQKVRPLAV